MISVHGVTNKMLWLDSNLYFRCDFKSQRALLAGIARNRCLKWALMIKYTKSSTGLWFDLIYIWWNHLFTHSSFNSNPSHATDFRSSRVFCKKAFLKISKNSQKNTCARSSFLIKLCRPPMFPFYTPWKYQKTSVSQLLTRLNVINKPFFTWARSQGKEF